MALSPRCTAHSCDFRSGICQHRIRDARAHSSLAWLFHVAFQMSFSRVSIWAGWGCISSRISSGKKKKKKLPGMTRLVLFRSSHILQRMEKNKAQDHHHSTHFIHTVRLFNTIAYSHSSAINSWRVLQFPWYIAAASCPHRRSSLLLQTGLGCCCCMNNAVSNLHF